VLKTPGGPEGTGPAGPPGGGGAGSGSASETGAAVVAAITQAAAKVAKRLNIRVGASRRPNPQPGPVRWNDGWAECPNGKRNDNSWRPAPIYQPTPIAN